MKKLLILFAVCFSMLSCTREVVYDNPFVYIALNGDSSILSSSTVSSQANNSIKTYNICLSSKAFTEPVTVSYDIKVGDGLKEGVDFQMMTQGNQVKFIPGVFIMPVRITFLRHTVDPSKDNTITITLTDAGDGMELGFPGPAHNNISHKITKIN